MFIASRGPAHGRSYADWERQTLSGAELWWVSDLMCDVLEQVYQTIPGDLALDEQTWTRTRGLAVFERDIVGIDARTGERSTAVRSVAWGPNHLAVVKHRFTPELLPCVTFSSYGWEAGLGRMVTLGRADWPIAEPLDVVAAAHESELDLTDEPHFDASVRDDRRLIAALWLVAAQPHLTELASHGLSWPQQKRARRAGLDQRPVRILRFRRPIHAPATTESGRRLQKRFVVSLHWRNQPCGPGGRNRKLILIAPHWRGPADGPVDTRPIVKALVR
jgi:hypothetical protein